MRYLYNTTEGWRIDNGESIIGDLPNEFTDVFDPRWTLIDEWAKGRINGCVPYGFSFEKDMIRVYVTVGSEEVELQILRLSDNMELFGKISLNP